MRDYYRELYGGFDDDEEEGVVRDGQRIRIPMTIMDSARHQEIRAACIERNATRKLSPETQRIVDGYRKLEEEREAYRKRISDAWKSDAQRDADAHRQYELDDLEAERNAYIRRISNAWRSH